MSQFDELFWAKVQTGDSCWLYTGAINQSGYGTLNRGHLMLAAHRLSWEQTRGPVPRGMCVLHRCDIRNCVRPSHLFLGSKADNMADAVAKDRHARGDRNGRKKLNEFQVRAIRQEYQRTGYHKTNAKELAARYGVGIGAIHAIARGDAWKHVSPS